MRLCVRHLPKAVGCVLRVAVKAPETTPHLPDTCQNLATCGSAHLLPLFHHSLASDENVLKLSESLQFSPRIASDQVAGPCASRARRIRHLLRAAAHAPGSVPAEGAASAISPCMCAICLRALFMCRLRGPQRAAWASKVTANRRWFGPADPRRQELQSTSPEDQQRRPLVRAHFA